MFASTLLDVPRPYIDPIYSLVESLGIACLALRRPAVDSTITLVLDSERRGIHLFPSTPLTQSTIHHIIGHVSSLPNAHGVVIISTRTTTPIQPHDSTLLIHTTVACRSAGFELIDWVVVGSGGLYCPRSLTDAPDPWSASATFL
jgi:hypothetical protein